MRVEPPPGAGLPGTMVDEAQGSSAGDLLKPDYMEHFVPGWSSPPPSPVGCSGSSSFLKAPSVNGHAGQRPHSIWTLQHRYSSQLAVGGFPGERVHGRGPGEVSM